MTDISAPALEPAGEFRVGRVLSRALTITSRNLLQFAVLVGVPLLPYVILFPSMMGGTPDFRNFNGGTFALSIIVSLVLGAIARAVVVHAAFQDMRGRPISIAESFSRGLSRFAPVIGLSIVMGLGTVFGLVLLFVPGMILITMWSVAMPVCVVEGLPVFESLSRSGVLTKGHRWQIFGILAVVGIISAVLGGIVGGIFSAVGGTLVSVIARFVVQVLVGAYGAVAVVVAYHDLRVAKEGVDVDRIAAVFD